MLQAANTNCPELRELRQHSRSRIRGVRYYTGGVLFRNGLKAMFDPTTVRLTYNTGLMVPCGTGKQIQTKLKVYLPNTKAE